MQEISSKDEADELIKHLDWCLDQSDGAVPSTSSDANAQALPAEYFTTEEILNWSQPTEGEEEEEDYVWSPLPSPLPSEEELMVSK